VLRLSRFSSSLSNRLLDLLFSLYDSLEEKEKDREISFADRILGEIMYGVEHTLETIPEILLYGHPREFFDEFGSNEWLGRCIPAYQTIIKDFTPVRADSIVVGDRVLTHTGRLQNVNKVYKRHYNGCLYNIDVSHLRNRVISLTYDHPVLTADGFKPVQFVNKGDFVAVPRVLNINDMSELYINDYLTLPVRNMSGFIYRNGSGYNRDFKKHAIDFAVNHRANGETLSSISKSLGISRSVIRSWCSRYESENNKSITGLSYSLFDRNDGVPIRVSIDNDFLWLAGIYVAEGSSTDYGQIAFSFGSHERDLIDRTKNILLNKFGMVFAERKVGSAVQLIKRSSVLSNFFINLFGKGAKNKRLPEFVFYLPAEKQKSVLSGVFDGDGSFSVDKRSKNGYGRHFVSTVSEVLAYQLLMLFNGLGIVVSLSYETNKLRTIRGRYIPETYIYRVSKGGRLDQLFSNSHYFKSTVSPEYVYLAVNGVSKTDYDGDVYNFDIDVDHTYCLPIVVHNCMEGRQCLKMIQWHENFPKGVSPLDYRLESSMIKSMKFFVGNCSIYDKMIEKSHRQFDLPRWQTPREYDLPFSLDPSDISKQQLQGRFEDLFRVCEVCPFKL